ncbi:MAG: hypothetical protein RLZZ124_559, partial [Cyanobacteriota bacterium]
MAGHIPMHRVRGPVPLAALALASLGLTAIPVAPASARGCQAPMPGRYAVMTMGTVGAKGSGTPTARVHEERWLADGAVEGRIVERLGRQLRSGSYRGSVRLVGTCRVEVSRQLPWGMQRSEAVLDGRGR